MTAAIVAAVVLCGSAVWFAHRPSARAPGTPVAGPGEVSASTARRAPALWAAAAGFGAWAFLSGAPGALAGVLAAVVVWLVLSRAETPEQRRRRLRVQAELPHIVGLLSAAVRGGLAPAEGLALVCQALPGPAADALATLPVRIRLGVDPDEVWRSLDGNPELELLGRTLARSARSGEPVADALDRLANELSARARARSEEAARRVGVQAAVPLGVCLLPAFLLLGIVPVVASLLRTVTP